MGCTTSAEGRCYVMVPMLHKKLPKQRTENKLHCNPPLTTELCYKKLAK